MSTTKVANISNLAGTKIITTDDLIDRATCRAWVNFDGTGTPAIRASFNVDSITDEATGDYTINFTNAMPDANYAWAGASQSIGYTCLCGKPGVPQTSISLRILAMGFDSNAYDRDYIMVQVFR